MRPHRQHQDPAPHVTHRRGLRAPRLGVRAVSVLALAVVLACSVGRVAAVATPCPLGCSGHGVCSIDSLCVCDTGFSGPACTYRTCPTGPAFAAKTTGTDSAHNSMECSNAGLCDTSTGDCKCFSGHTGIACERTLCPNSCSNAGRCMPISHVAQLVGFRTNASRWDDAVGPAYSNWDAEVLYGCVCDWDRTGPDCSLRMCPKGDDVRTKRQLRYVISLDVGNTYRSSAVGGSYRVNFAGHNTTALNASCYDTTATTLSAALEALEPIENATVYQSAVDAPTHGCRYTIVLDFARFGQNNVFSFDSEPDINLFNCVDDGADAATTGLWFCHFARVPLTMTASGGSVTQSTYKIQISDTEYVPNSFQFSKDNGNWSQPIRITGSSQLLDGEELAVTFSSTQGWTKLARWIVTTNYTTNVVASSPTYREHVYCGGRALCDMSTGSCGTCTGSSFGETCNYLSFEDIVPETALDKNFRKLNPTLSNYTSDIVRIRIHQWESENYDAIRMATNEEPTFRVSGSGIMHGLSADFNAFIETGTLRSEAGITVDTQGLNIVSGGASVTTGTLLAPDGLTINSTANIQLVNAHSSHASFGDTTLQLSSGRGASDAFNMLTLRSAGYTVFDLNGDGSLTIQSSLVASAGGLSVNAGGLNVSTGGMTVNSGRLYTTTAQAGNPPLHADAKHDVFVSDVIRTTTSQAKSSSFNLLKFQDSTPDELFSVRGDGLVTVKEGGMHVVQDGTTVQAGGLVVVDDGSTITTGGLKIDAGGMTVTAGGIASDKPVNATVHNFVSRPAFVVDASHASFGSKVLDVVGNGGGTPSSYHIMKLRSAGECLLCIRADGLLRLPGSAILGADTSHRLTMTSTVQLGQLVFEGITKDANELTMQWPALTADRNVLWPDKDGGDNMAALTSGLTADRLPIVDNSGILTTTADLTYDTTNLDMNGPSTAALKSESGSITLSASTTALLRAASGDLTLLPDFGRAIRLEAPHATNGDITLSGGNDFSIGASGDITLVSDDSTTSGLVSVTTGATTAGNTGSIVLATGAVTGKTSVVGGITLSVASTTVDASTVLLEAGASTVTSGVGGHVVIRAGNEDASHAEEGVGGSVSITAGTGGTANGGTVELRGNFNIKDKNGAVVVDADASVVDITATQSGSVYIDSTGLARAQSSSNAVTLTAEAGIMVSSDANAITVNADTLLSLTTTNTAGIAAPIIVSAGKSTGNGANAVFYGGDTSSSGNIGGRVTVTAGASTTSGKGGSVSIRGGAGSATGGGLTLVPGPTAAGTDGQIVIHDAAGTPNRVIVVDDDVTTVTPVTFTTTASGAITLSSTGSTATVRANNDIDISSGAAAFSLHADSGGITLTTADLADAADIAITAGSTLRILDSAHVTITAGTAGAASKTGGHVSITAGAGVGGAGRDGGNVVLTGGLGTATSGGVVLQDGTGTARVSATPAFSTAGSDTSVRTDSGGTTSGDITLSTGAATTSGSITVRSGAALGSNAGEVSIVGGSSNNDNNDIVLIAGTTTLASASAGDVSITGGASTDSTGTTGGHVSIVGGDGGGTGGTGGAVSILPGVGATTDGSVKFRDGSNTDRLVVTPAGAISVSAVDASEIVAASALAFTSSSTASLAAAGAVNVLSTGAAVTALAEDGLTLSTAPTTTGSAGSIAITVGVTTHTATGGHVSIVAGATTGSAGGNVAISAGAAYPGPSYAGVGGSVSVVGGVGVTTGGNVEVRPGTGADVLIRSTPSNTIATIDANVAIAATSSLALSSSSTAAFTTSGGSGITANADVEVGLFSTTALSVVAGTSLTLTTVDAGAGVAGGPISVVGSTSSGNEGADVVFVSGATTTADTGGAVSITAGSSAGSAGDFGGNVIIKGGKGSTAHGAIQVVSPHSGGTVRATVTGPGVLETDAESVSIESSDLASGPTGDTAIHSGIGTTGTVGDLTLTVGASTTGTAGDVELKPGNAGDNGGSVSITAGLATADSKTGGMVAISAGAATSGVGSVGGTVSITGGGAGTAAVGGGVIMKPGTGSSTANNGYVTIKDGVSAAGGDRIKVNRAVTLSGIDNVGLSSTGTMVLTTGSTLTASAGGALTLTTNALMSLTGRTGVTVGVLPNTGGSAGNLLVTVGDTTTTANGGNVVITAGKTTASGKKGGSVSLTGGASTSNVGGGFVIRGGDGVTDGAVTWDSVATATTVMQVASDGSFSVDATSVRLSTIDTAGGSGDMTIQSGTSTSGNTGHIAITSGVATGTATAGTISVKPGTTFATTAAGGNVVVNGGTSTATATNGGEVSIIGGAASTGTGGAVSIVGGTAADLVTTGGDVVLKMGDGSPDGNIILADGGGTARLTVDSDGDVVISTKTSSLGHFIASGAVTLSSTTTLAVSASTTVDLSSDTGVVVVSGNTGTTLTTSAGTASAHVTAAPGSSADNGAVVAITGGSTATASKTGGHVVMTGGSTNNAAGGHVSINGGDGGAVGGNVVLQMATGGQVTMADATPTNRLWVTAAGAVSATPVSATIEGTGAVSLVTTAASSTTRVAGTTLDITAGADVTMGYSTTTLIQGEPDGSGSVRVAIQPGATTGSANGGPVIVAGGLSTGVTSEGGQCQITGGASGSTGGLVAIAGGDATTATGGTVWLQAGDGTPDGRVELQDSTEHGIVVVEETGTVAMKGLVTLSAMFKANKRVTAQYYAFPAGQTITAYTQANILIVTDDGAVWPNDINVAGTPLDGQLYVVVNNDAQATSGAFTVASGAKEAFIYSADTGSWHKYDS